ncbi:sigma-70 family RNA polymerase sigma factor, partial [bacterium]
LFQEAVIHLWEDFNAGKLDDKTDSYILQGCYFYLKNYLRKAGTNKVLISLDGVVQNEEHGLDGFAFLSDPKAEDYPDRLNNKMLVDTIMNNGLTGREKEILSFFKDGLTTREIGKKIGVSHVRVVKLMQGIREKCKKHLDH